MESQELVSQQDLARIVGYTPRQIRRLLEHPSCPGKIDDLYHVEEWTEFLATHGRKAPAATRKAELEAEKLEIHNRRQLWKHECEKRVWTRNVDIAPAIQRFDDEIIRLLRESLEKTIPRLGAGKSEDALRVIGKSEVDRIMTAIHRGNAELIATFPVPLEEQPQ